MLEELRIRGLGVIDDAKLPLGPGLTVVTGETGAGKTMVVTGLQLLFGGRGDATRVRADQELAIIDGRLLLEPEMLAALEPDVHLVGTLLALRDYLPDEARATARRVVASVVEQIEAIFKKTPGIQTWVTIGGISTAPSPIGIKSRPK